MPKNALVFILFTFIFGYRTESGKQKYILYDVNPGEGFNLRRDVFMRVAVLLRKLNIQQPDIQFILVLPPWGHLYHWQTRTLGPQTRIPWGLFFDTESISYFVPAIEFSEYLAREGPRLDMVYYLQGYEGGWKDGKYEEKYEIAKCLDPPVYEEDSEGLYQGYFWDYSDVRSEKFECLSVQGSSRVLHKFLAESPFNSIMLDRAESLLHDFFGDVDYWGARRSMRFASHLVQIANKYREEELNSTDVGDNTLVEQDWRTHRAERTPRGGPFACVHLRRRDYVRARKGQIPTIKGAAEQLVRKLDQENVDTLFVSSDAPNKEFEELRSYLKNFKVLRFQPSTEVFKKYKDGGVAILDQLICSHARYFIGSFESTFTFRIQEEREIMGFPLKSTFDMLCPDGKVDCEKGIQWKVDWGTPDQDWTIKRPEKHVEL